MPAAPFLPPPPAARLPFPYRDEVPLVRELCDAAAGALDWPAAVRTATPWVQAVRDNPPPFWAMESLLHEYPISTAEGLALMRLAEALLRVPDAETAVALTADQLGRADFDADAGAGPHRMMASLSASAIALSKRFLPENESPPGVLQRLGAKTVVAATVRAIQLLGRQFVLGRTIGEAMAEAERQRQAQPTLRLSYDMLGEGARTDADAQRHLAAYQAAIESIAGGRRAASPHEADGISVKLSALFPRYEDAQRERVFAELLPRVWTLIERAAEANINLTVDAEESDRLELSLDVFEALAERIAQHCPRWDGFGLAIQAYLTNGPAVVDVVAAIARRHGLRFMVRLVKGAYWDGEVKRAQEGGLPGYPVFTHKQHTDIAYLACARTLLAHHEVIYPQFASHNAGTIAAIVQMARREGAHYEFQRLHGMAEGIFREVLRDTTIACRLYAPVGEHRDLLAYLVRRLLENGANSSFVHQLADASVTIEALLETPLRPAATPGLPAPCALYGPVRDNALGVDLACLAMRAPLERAWAEVRVQPVGEAAPDEVPAAMVRLHGGLAAWKATPVAERAATLRRAGDALETQLAPYCALLVGEAGKTWGDAIAEVREAIDFCRYYAQQAESAAPPLEGRGVFVCISPWNFPLAIFAGQVVAALVAGNTVAAKPAEQTPAVAQRFVALLHAAGVPADALVLLHGPGETVGARLVADPHTAGVAFTGSTPVAQHIHRTLARHADPLVPLIAETGGLNAMVVDSTALPEQVIDAVVQSAFRSAGQRCSALRLLCVHEGIADALIAMLAGAMAELRVGDPAELATDVGPLIDAEAHAGVARHVERLKREARLIAESPTGAAGPRHQRPIAFEIARIADLREEIFGPVLHVVRWGGDADAVVTQINALGYGLTLGLQTRIDSRAERLADAARVGNVYVNRNMVGAVVGVQPFGGEGLSGTGPKAGGPHYLRRFSADREPVIGSRSTAIGRAEGLALDAVVARAAQSPWTSTPLGARCDRLERAASVLAEAGFADAGDLALALAARSRTELAEQALPGPTGERNTLRLHPRGVLASVTDDDPTLWADHALSALAAGNALIAVAPADALGAWPRWVAAMVRCGWPEGAWQALDAPAADAAAALAADERIAGLCCAPAWARALRPALAARRGAIAPLVVGPAGHQLWRLAAEQTLTVNTAAAGGNADLLAGVSRA